MQREGGGEKREGGREGRGRGREREREREGGEREGEGERERGRGRGTGTGRGEGSKEGRRELPRSREGPAGPPPRTTARLA